MKFKVENEENVDLPDQKKETFQEHEEILMIHSNLNFIFHEKQLFFLLHEPFMKDLVLEWKYNGHEQVK